MNSSNASFSSGEVWSSVLSGPADMLISVGGEPFGRRLKPHPARHFSRKIDFAPLGMPRWIIELIDLAKERIDELGDPLVARGVLRPGIGDEQRPVRDGRNGSPLSDQVRIVFMREICGKIGCEQLAQLVIWRGFLVEREEMHAVFLLHLR